MPAMLESMAGRFDLLHLHSVWEPIVVLAARFARRRRIPYVVAPHGMLSPYSLQQRWLKKRLALAVTYRRVLNQALFLHTLNADEAELIKPLGLRAPLEVIPNGVFLEELANVPAPGTFRAAHPQLDGSPYVLFLSRLHPKKGLDYLARAFALLAARDERIHLVVAGPDSGARADFEHAIAATGLSPRVHVVGPLYGRDKLAAFADARCFCLPSRDEGFSVAVAEALACSVPVVVSRGCHFPEVAEAGAGEVAELNAESIAQALWRVLHEHDAAAMGRAGRALVATRFTWPRIAEQSMAAYERRLN